MDLRTPAPSGGPAPLTLERWFAALGSPPAHDLARSGAAALSLGQLLQRCGADATDLLEQSLDYGPGNGSVRLLDAIRRSLGVAADTQVVVTSGAVEALLLVCLVARPGHVLVGSPAYDGLIAAPLAAGRAVREVEVWTPARGLDLEPLAAAIDGDTSLVVVNSPHNPTGAVAGLDQLDRLAGVCARRGARLVVDEVARATLDAGALSAAATIGFAAGTTLAIGDVSKSLGLGGLRIGWVAGNADVCAAVAAAKDGTTVSSGVLSERLAALALEQATVLLEEVRGAALANLEELCRTVGCRGWRRPEDGLVAFPALPTTRPAAAIVDDLRRQAVSVVPGELFGHPGRVRVGLGSSVSGFADAMAILAGTLAGS